MNYLQQLKAEKQARDSYFEDSVKLKVLVNKVTDYHAIHDGEFLKQLEQFLNNYNSK